MPDFDIDFCQDERDEVIHYVRGKYGDDNVGQIITFGSLKAKSVIRDVGRVHGPPLRRGRPDRQAGPRAVLGNTPPLKDLVYGKKAEKDGDVASRPSRGSRSSTGSRPSSPSSPTRPARSRSSRPGTCSRSRWRWRGCNRQAGMHAAGVVIADKPLWEYVPAYKDEKSGMLITQFAKDEVEAAGLVKFDFLGLKTLTVIHHALDLVKRNHPELGRLHRRRHPDRRSGRLRADQPRRHRRRLPDGVLGLHRDGEEAAPLVLRGRHRRRRALPPRPARPEARGRPDDGRRLHRPQARAREGHLPAPEPGAGAQGRPTASSSTRSR